MARIKLKFVLIFSALVFMLSACAGTNGLIQSNRSVTVIHDVSESKVRSMSPQNLFEKSTFADTANITAEKLSEQTGHVVLLAQIRDREKLHYHEEHDLLVQLLNGTGKLKTPTQTIPVKPGDWTLIPRSVKHQFINTGAEPARALVIRTPPPADGRDYVPVER